VAVDIAVSVAAVAGDVAVVTVDVAVVEASAPYFRLCRRSADQQANILGQLSQLNILFPRPVCLG
jgi:hypothetical protein